MRSVVSAVAEFLRTQDLLGTTGIIALSGGPDSVALALSCRHLRDEGHLPDLQLAHLNHLLRGPESDADEAFVRRLASRWKLPLHVERRDVAAFADSHKIGVEEAARRVRYDWLADLAVEHSARWVSTAHHADDQAETVLHHVLRGTGLAGLAGIARRRSLKTGIDLIRPLLTVSRHEIEEYLRAEAIEARSDASNVDLRFTRNRLRHQLLPQLVREFNPALIDVLNRLARQAGEWNDAITGRAAQLLSEIERPRAGGVVVLARDALARTGPLMIREIVREIWRREAWPAAAMNFEDWERFELLVSGELSRHDFPGGMRAQSTQHVVQIWRLP